MEIKRLGEEHRANLQLGYEIHECWEPILNNCKPRCHGQHFFVEIVQMQIHMSLRNCHLLSCCNNLHIAVTPEEDYPKIVET